MNQSNIYEVLANLTKTLGTKVKCISVVILIYLYMPHLYSAGMCTSPAVMLNISAQCHPLLSNS